MSSGLRLIRLAAAIAILSFPYHFFVLPSFPLLGHGHVLNLQSSCRQSHPLGRGSTKTTRWTRGAWSLSRKRAAASNCSNQSSPHSPTSSSTQGNSSGLPPISHPSISLFTSHFLCVLCKILATYLNLHDLGVCSPPNGLEIALRCSSFVFSNVRFNLVGAENHDMHYCTTHGIPIS